MKISIIGASGRMGRMILRAVANHPKLEISGALVESGSEFIGKTIGSLIYEEGLSLKVTDNMDKVFHDADAVIDFSTPICTLSGAAMAAEQQKIFISGTTPIDEEQKEKLSKYGNKTVVLWSSNMSIGVNLLMKLSKRVGAVLDAENYDAEIFEMHHNQKVDSPSGTATSLGKAVAQGRGVDFREVYCGARDGIVGKRTKGEIGFSALRGGDVIGDHSVIFAGNGERVELTHKASNREIYANGAIRACLWAVGKKAGFYSMLDVLD